MLEEPISEEFKELQNPYLHIYTPIEFQLTQIMSTNSSKQVNGKNGSDQEQKEQEEFLRLLSKYENTPLPKASTIGLKNLGNNCYMNSIIQILVNHPILYYYFQNMQEKSYSGDTLKFSAIGFIRRLIGVCFGGVNSKGKELKNVRLTSLVRNVDQINKRFERGKQQDAMSFLRNFLQRLMTEISPMKVEKSGLYKLFTGKQIRSIHCPACKFDQEIEEKVPNIGILEGYDRSLRQARQSSLKDIEISGWKCQRCESETTAIQKTRVTECKSYYIKIKFDLFQCLNSQFFTSGT